MYKQKSFTGWWILRGESSCFYPQTHEWISFWLILAYLAHWSRLDFLNSVVFRISGSCEFFLVGAFCSPGGSPSLGNSPPTCKSFRRKRPIQASGLSASSFCFFLIPLVERQHPENTGNKIPAGDERGFKQWVGIRNKPPCCDAIWCRTPDTGFKPTCLD